MRGFNQAVIRMMGGERTLPACALALALLAGCYPTQMIVAKGLDTRIIDAKTGGGIPGAKVTLKGSLWGSKKEETMVSGPDGAVSIGTLVDRVWVPMLPILPMTPGGDVVVEADGYTTFSAMVEPPGIRSIQPERPGFFSNRDGKLPLEPLAP